MLLTLQDLHALAAAALTRHGLAPEHVEAIADTVTAAERDECHHHGVFRIPFYVNAVRSGQASPTAMPEISRLAPGVVRVDARGGFAPLSLARGLPEVAARAKEQGIAALAINNTYHVAALWPEVEWLAERGLVAMACTASGPYVAPAGGTKPLFGTNPFAFGWPRHARPPLVFDQASSMSARGAIQLRLREGRPLPDGWAIGPDGQPTTDPTQALAGAQLPFGGAKGSSIALMIELLAGPLLGDLLSFESGERDVAKTGAPLGGELVIAIDPARFVVGGDREAQLAHGERLFAKILEQEGARLPSDRRYAARRRTATEGVTVPDSLYQSVKALTVG